MSPKPKHYDPLQRQGKPFAGVINDVKHRFPHYGSDFKDALHFQCITSLVFMFFAAFAPAISFGGLLGKWMGWGGFPHPGTPSAGGSLVSGLERRVVLWATWAWRKTPWVPEDPRTLGPPTPGLAMYI